MTLKDSEAYHKPNGSKYLVGSSSAPYCNSKYTTHMKVMVRGCRRCWSTSSSLYLCEAGQEVGEVILFTEENQSGRPKRFEGELQGVVAEEFMRMSEGNVSEFQKKKASGALPTDFPTMDEKDDVDRIMTEVEPLLGASGYRTRRNILMTHGGYPCHCLAQTL